MFTLLLLCSFTFAAPSTIKSTFRVGYQCPEPVLSKTRLDVHPELDQDVKQLIQTEICKVVNAHSCEARVFLYASEEIEVRRLLADYENMYMFISIKIDSSLDSSAWYQLQDRLTSSAWLNDLTSKARLASPQGMCLTFRQAAFPQQSGACWSFDLALERNMRVQEGKAEIHLFGQEENEFCSFRLSHQGATCDYLQQENGQLVTKMLSMATYDVHTCANRAAADKECGWSFSWNKMEGTCICSRPGFLCGDKPYSAFGDVYTFRSGNFGKTPEEEEEEPETTDPTVLSDANGKNGEESEGAEAEETKGGEEETETEETEEPEVDDDNFPAFPGYKFQYPDKLKETHSPNENGWKFGSLLLVSFLGMVTGASVTFLCHWVNKGLEF